MKITMTAETKASESFNNDLKEIPSLKTGMSLFGIIKRCKLIWLIFSTKSFNIRAY